VITVRQLDGGAAGLVSGRASAVSADATRRWGEGVVRGVPVKETAEESHGWRTARTTSGKRTLPRQTAYRPSVGALPFYAGKVPGRKRMGSLSPISRASHENWGARGT